MIHRIGVIYQDVYSFGFLEGLKRRLDCKAELVPPQGTVGRSKHMTRRQAQDACRFFQGKDVDVIIRFTDADRDRWQDVKRHGQAVFSQNVHGICVFGVAVNNPEEWLARTPQYLAKELGLDVQALVNEPDKASMIKGAIDRSRKLQAEVGADDVGRSVERSSDVVVRLVTKAPEEVFRQWLAEDSFRDFYSECRRIAKQFDCETRNEL